jgi:hypothetical protein
MQIKKIVQVFLSLIVSALSIIWYKVQDFFLLDYFIVIPENS